MTDLPEREPERDIFAVLRGLTQARIGLGRAGQALPTRAMLEFQTDHARARDAVHAVLDVERMRRMLGDGPVVRSAAGDRAHYLQDPDLGRRLAEDTAGLEPDYWDLAIVVGDGLSATAVHAHAAAVVKALQGCLPGWRIAPVVLAMQARVALGDDVAERLGARAVVMLLGERPGLSAPDSLGAYLTWAPRRGTRDSARNCVSNIRTPGGLAPDDAARKIAWLLNAARRLGASGVALKDRSDDAILPPDGEAAV